jgi:hypothetical protein
MPRKRKSPHRKVKEAMIVSIRFEMSEYLKVQEIAALESLVQGKKIFTHDLIREAVKFTYSDNERLRECFRRSRVMSSRMTFMGKK